MLTLQLVPYSEIEDLDSDGRITKLLEIVKENRIVLMQGRLDPGEEAGLIKKTMTEIGDQFKGVEICTIYPEERNLQFFSKMRKNMIKFILGNREGITIIGPATIVRDIKRDPNKIMLYAEMPRMREREKARSHSKQSRVKRRR